MQYVTTVFFILLTMVIYSLARRLYFKYNRHPLLNIVGISVAVIIAVSVNTEGQREVLGMKVGASEAEPFWTEFLRSL